MSQDNALNTEHWSDGLVNQVCQRGLHPEWWSMGEHHYRCPWCVAAGQLTVLRALVDSIKFATAPMVALTVRENGNYVMPGVLLADLGLALSAAQAIVTIPTADPADVLDDEPAEQEQAVQ